MSNNLKRMEKDLRALVKRCKDIKYTRALLLNFLLMGMLIFSEVLTSPEVKSTENAINQTRKELNTSINDMYSSFRQARRENNRLLKNANLELIQLMEQGDQLVKSPWSSWQFGLNYFYSNWRGTYKGRGDKKEKYPYEGIFNRDSETDEMNKYVMGDSLKYISKLLNPYSASTTSRQGLNSGYGLMSSTEVSKKPVNIEFNASIRPRNIRKESSLNLPKLSITLPTFESKIRLFPKISEKNVEIQNIPISPSIKIGYQDVPGEKSGNIIGFDTDGTLANNGIVSELDLTGGTYNVLFTSADSPIEYDFVNPTTSDTGFHNAASFVTGLGTATNSAAFHGIGGAKANVTINPNVTVNAIGKYSGGDIPSVYYLGNHISRGLPEVKLTHDGILNLYGNNITVVNIDNVDSPDNIKFVNNGTITGHADSGIFNGTPNTFTPEIHIFGSFTYGADGVDIIENSGTGNIKFYAPRSVGWAYTASSNQRVKRSSINNGILKLYGKNSLGIALAGDALSNNVQISWADIQLNTPIEILGDFSVGASIVTEWDSSASANFENSKFNIKIGDNTFLSQDAIYGDVGGSDSDTTKVQNSVGLNFDFTASGTGTIEKKIKNWKVEIGENAKNSVAIRLGKANMEFDDTDPFNFVLIGGEKNIGFLSDKTSELGSDTAHLKYKNVNNRFIITGKDTILFAANNGGKLEVANTLTLTSANLTPFATGFTLGYASEINSILNFNGGVTGTVNGKEAVLFYAKNNGTINVTETSAGTIPKIKIESTDGIGYYAKDGGKINARYSNIKLDDSEVAVYSDGIGSNIDLKNSIIDYTGKGYALYVNNGGKIDMTNGTLILKGKAVGFEKDLSGGNPAITTTGMLINVYSNDVTVVNLKNAPNLNLSGLQANLTGLVGITGINNNDGTNIYENYKLAAIDGLASYNIDKNLDKSIAALGGVDVDADMFTKNLQVQRAKVNVLSGNTVTSHLNTTETTALGNSSVVGLAMNSSVSAVNRNETQINIQSGASVSADRTNAGSGAIGLFINYGEANIDNGGTLKVERYTENGANDSGVGVYSVNGSAVNNNGKISVGGAKSIGILGLSYRTDVSNIPIIDEFGTVAGQGNVSVNNHAGGKIELDGQESVGIYVENNDTSITPHNIVGVNAGIITMSGLKGVGMAAKKFNSLTNTGVINITADQGVGMFGIESGVLSNAATGTITVGDSSSDSLIRLGMLTEDDGVNISSDGTINIGKNSYGIFGKDVRLGLTSVTNIGENGVGVFSRATTNNSSGNVQIQAGSTLNIGDNEAVGVFTENISGGIVVEDLGSNMNIGKGSYGYVFKGTDTTFTNTNTGNIFLGNKSVYLYSADTAGNITNNTLLTSTGDATYGLYSAGTVVNNGNINFNIGIGNIGIYHTGGGEATNYSNILIGTSDPSTDRYAIGMAAGFNGNSSKSAFIGKVVNEGTINVNGSGSIGMYGTKSGTEIYNGTTPGSSATINLNVDGAVGMYLDDNAKGYNYGIITTVGTPNSVVGVSVKNNAEFINYGTITINSAGGIAAFNDGGKLNLKNYGTINLSGGAVEESSPTVSSTTVTVGEVSINSPNGPATSPAVITKNGVEVKPVYFTVPEGIKPIKISGFAMYVDTLRGTNPVNGLSSLGNTTMDLIIGSDIAESTNMKYIQVSGGIIDPYIKTIKANPQITEWNIYSASLTWIATVTRANGGSGDIENIYLAKIPYTNWAGKKATPVEVTDTYNFLDGLEQRYGVEGLGTREKALFDKLNSIGNNEEILFYQATDEMMGHQYANTQQRIYGTGRLLDKEFTHLKKEWDNKSKQSNKIKAFGMRDEYKTDTAGVIDYTSDAYGVAYVHEDETIKLGNSTGWYAGAVHNRFKFKDIGKSKEDTTMLKVGVFKSKAFDHNGSLNWTISGEGYVSRSDMHRKFLVVDEIFNAKSSYYTYGAALKNEISKEFRTSERTSIKPYGSLKLEYGRFGSIKEKTGEVRLEIEGNDYYSVRPEVGVEFKYKQPVAKKTTFVTTLGLGYENELGKVGDVGNRGRVRYTTADWFNIRGEKDDRKGNFKADLNVGVENQRVGVTFNVGYDTKGENIRGGIGFRAIY